MRILLAEDNVVNQKVAVGLLSQRGHAVTVAENGRKALDAVAARAFDLVLMDVQMPEMGGLEATAAIRERCLAAGMDGHIAKPIDPQMLFTTVEEQTTSSPPERAAPPEAGPHRSSRADRSIGAARPSARATKGC